MLKIRTVKSKDQLPHRDLRPYELGGGFTEKDAIEDFQRRYRFTPQEGWRCGTYLYFKEPGEKKC